MIRSHSRASRVFARDRRLSSYLRRSACGLGSVPDHAALCIAFVSAERNSSLPRAPSQPQGGASLRSRWPCSEGCERTRAILLRDVTRAGRERKRVEDARWLRTRTCGTGGEPRLVVSLHTSCHPFGPASRRNNAIRADDRVEDLRIRRRASRGKQRLTVRLTEHCCLGNPPREGRDPSSDRGVFSPSEPTPTRGSVVRPCGARLPSSPFSPGGSR